MATPSHDPELMTQLELEAMADMQRRMMSECWKKCVPHIKDGELAIGEMSCVDRCVPKYFEVHALVAEEYKKVDDLAAQQQRMQDAFASVRAAGKSA